MARKIIEKKIPQFELDFQDILICNAKEFRPNLEVLIGEPENVSQQNLGTLFGVFEITDESEDSSYIVNYLVSVIKKEFFSKPKRGPIESFEGALHKTNLALSKLAEHENIGWIGKLNAVCALIERNQFHFTQTGETSVLLLRNKQLLNLSEGIEESPEPNPLKTFVDISSGKIEEDDRIIITTNEIFDIFSMEEIKKSALRFSPEKFLQFLKTALGNELEKTVLLCASIKQKSLEEEKSAKKSTTSSRGTNFFSQEAFEKPKAKATQPSLNEELEIAKIEQEQEGNFTDKKTGHIYIKEDYKTEESPNITERFSFWKNRASDKKFFSSDWKNKFKKPEIKNPLNQERLFTFWKALKNFSLILAKKLLQFFYWTRNKLTEVLRKQSAYLKKEAEMATVSPDKKIGKIKSTFSLLSSRQKIYALLVLFFILIVPYFIAGYMKKQDLAKEELAQKNVPPAVLPLENEKNLKRVESVSNIFEASNLKQIINLNGAALGLTENQIINLDDKNLYEMNSEVGKIRLAVPMNDLNLVLILNDNNQIISFSPAAKKFQLNNINLPSSSVSLGTFLTYLYILSPENNQIYRYPRAEGGFGEKTDWIKSSENLTNLSQMAINENIYLSDNKNLVKFFKGKKQEFNLETPTNPLSIDSIFTTEDSSFVYILDTSNSRILKIDSDGQISNQFYNSEIKNAKSIAIFEDKNLAYFTTENAIKSFSLE